MKDYLVSKRHWILALGAVVFWLIGLGLYFADMLNDGGNMGLIFGTAVFGMLVMWLVSLIVDPNLAPLSRTAFVIGYFGMTFFVAAFLRLIWWQTFHGDYAPPGPGGPDIGFTNVFMLVLYGPALFALGLVSWLVGAKLASRS